VLLGRYPGYYRSFVSQRFALSAMICVLSSD
jgi:hypothetical protein